MGDRETRPLHFEGEGTPFVVSPNFCRAEIEIYATKCQILRIKCTQFNFGWGSAPDPAEGAYSAPGHLAGFKGTYF